MAKDTLKEARAEANAKAKAKPGPKKSPIKTSKEAYQKLKEHAAKGAEMCQEFSDILRAEGHNNPILPSFKTQFKAIVHSLDMKLR